MEPITAAWVIMQDDKRPEWIDVGQQQRAIACLRQLSEAELNAICAEVEKDIGPGLHGTMPIRLAIVNGRTNATCPE